MSFGFRLLIVLVNVRYLVFTSGPWFQVSFNLCRCRLCLVLFFNVYILTLPVAQRFALWALANLGLNSKIIQLLVEREVFQSEFFCSGTRSTWTSLV